MQAYTAGHAEITNQNSQEPLVSADQALIITNMCAKVFTFFVILIDRLGLPRILS